MEQECVVKGQQRPPSSFLLNKKRSGPWRESHQGLGATLANTQGYSGKFAIPRQSDRLCKSG